MTIWVLKALCEQKIKDEQFHTNCETCPYWLKNKYNCIWNAHKIIGKDVMAYWDDEIEERIL